MKSLQKAARNGGTSLAVVRMSNTTPAEEHMLTANSRHDPSNTEEGLLGIVIVVVIVILYGTVRPAGREVK